MADLTITAANVATGTDAKTANGTAGATITAGQALYIDATDSNKIKLADANASLATSALVGVSLHAALSGQPITYQISGEMNPGATLAVGTIYVLSATAGGIAPAAPGVTDLATGMYTNIVGIGKTATNMKLVIATAGVAVP